MRSQNVFDDEFGDELGFDDDDVEDNNVGVGIEKDVSNLEFATANKNHDGDVVDGSNDDDSVRVMNEHHRHVWLALFVVAALAVTGIAVTTLLAMGAAPIAVLAAGAGTFAGSITLGMSMYRFLGPPQE